MSQCVFFISEVSEELLSSLFLCLHVCTPELEISGSAAVEPRQDGAGVFLLPVVEVFTVPIHVCVMRSENTLYLMAIRRRAGYFRLGVWVAAVRMSETDR